VTPEAYITSGILELYVLQSLQPEEMAEVEEMAHHHVEVRTAIADIRESLAAYGQLHAETPPAPLRSKILTAIAAEVENTPAVEIAPKVLQMTSGAEVAVRYARIAIAASISLFLVSLLTAANFYLRWQEAATLANTLLAEKTVLAAERALLQTSAAEGKELLALIANPDIRLVNLQGTDSYPEASALVAWNPLSSAVYLWVNALPQPADDQQYQLWAIVDGQPVDAGIFDIEVGSKQMKAFEKVEAFAITLEPKGGSVAPTLEQLHVIGTI